MPRQQVRKKKSYAPKTVFGMVLRSEREKLGYSQESFAHHSGYHRNYIGQLERGEKSPSLKALFDFAKALGTKASELLRLVEQQMVGRF